MILAGKHAAAVSRLAAQQDIEGGKLIEVNFCRPIREIRLPKNRERHSSKAASTQVEMCRYSAQSSSSVSTAASMCAASRGFESLSQVIKGSYDLASLECRTQGCALQVILVHHQHILAQ